MTSSATATDRASETFAALSGLYRSPMIAQAILNGRLEGASNPKVVRLVTYLLSEKGARAWAREYRNLWSLNGGFRKLMTACRWNRRVQSLVALAGYGRRMTAQEIDTAVSIVCAYIDAQ